MVSSKTSKMISLAISLLAVVISLTGIATAATAPTVSTLTRYAPGFVGIPGKMARDAAGNFYVTDFWAKGIVKLDRQGGKVGFIPTLGRPSAVAVMKDNRLVVAFNSPQAYVAMYSQSGSAPNITGQELFQFAAPAKPFHRPSAVTVDAAGYIYVLDAGDMSRSLTDNLGCVRVYELNAAGDAALYRYVFGARNAGQWTVSTTLGEFNQPMGIAYEKVANQIVIADSMNGRLQFYTAFNGTSCSPVKFVGSIVRQATQPVVNAPVKFGDPADIAFEYDAAGTVLNRIYVAERGRHEITAVDPAGTNWDLKRISGTTVTGADMKFPSGVTFEKTAVGGVLYVNSAATTATADMLVLGIDTGSVPVPTVALTISAVSPNTAVSPLSIGGTVSTGYNVTCKTNGVNSTQYTLGGSSWNMSLPLVTGVNSITCSATGGTVTTYAEASTYYGSTTAAPVVNITSPAAGLYTKNADVTVTGKTTIDGTTALANVTVKLVNSNGGSTSYTTSDANGNWSAAVTLAENSNLITVTGWKQGTEIGSASVTITADYSPPVMTNMISFLTDGATTVYAVQNLDGIVLEKNLSSVVVNDEIVAVKVPLAGDNTYFSIPVTLARGNNSVTVTATDLAGNTSSISRTVVLNPEIPGVTVALPADNSYRANIDPASASGTVGTGFTSVNIAGAEATLGSGTWSATGIGIASGFGPYPVTASGGGNTTVSEKRSITGNAVEDLAITSPPADLATNSPSVIIAGAVAAESAAPTISVDGAQAVAVSSYTSATGAFSHSVALPTEGLHYVKVIADGGTTAVRNIVYDANAPLMAIQANAVLSPSQITGTIEPSAKLAGITAKIGGVDTPLPISIVNFDTYDSSKGVVVWHANLASYSIENISFATVDPAGNQTTRFFVNGIPTGDIDMDGVVRLSDAMACLRHVAGTELLSGAPTIKDTPRFQADVGSLIENRAAQDGDVTIEDAVLILKKAYGLMNF